MCRVHWQWRCCVLRRCLTCDVMESVRVFLQELRQMRLLLCSSVVLLIKSRLSTRWFLHRGSSRLFHRFVIFPPLRHAASSCRSAPLSGLSAAVACHQRFAGFDLILSAVVFFMSLLHKFVICGSCFFCFFNHLQINSPSFNRISGVLFFPRPSSFSEGTWKMMCFGFFFSNWLKYEITTVKVNEAKHYWMSRPVCGRRWSFSSFTWYEARGVVGMNPQWLQFCLEVILLKCILFYVM